jgi:hypothetical protein
VAIARNTSERVRSPSVAGLAEISIGGTGGHGIGVLRGRAAPISFARAREQSASWPTQSYELRR